MVSPRDPSRSRTGACAEEPGGADHRRVVGAQPGPRHDRPDAALRGPVLDALAQDAVRGHSTTDHDRPGAALLCRAQRLGRQHVDDRVLEAVSQLGHRRFGQCCAVEPSIAAASTPSSSRDLPPRRRLQAAEREVERVGHPGARERPVVHRRGLGRAHDRRATGIRQPEQAADLVERLARGVVDGLAEQSVSQVVRASRQGTCGRR